MSLRHFFAALVATLAIPAFATPQPRDATDLWLNGSESGWGLNIFHQGDTLFASLFVYGPDGQPKWYTGSALTGGPTVYSGALTEATGPWFGAATFDPNAVTRRTVGTMTFTLGDSSSTVDYTIDGRRVTKKVTRFSFEAMGFGASVATVYQPPSAGAEIRKDLILSYGGDGSSVTMTTADAAQSCIWNGQRGANGRYVTVTGTYSCGSAAGPLSMVLEPTISGFTGTFSGNGITSGRIAGVVGGYRSTRGANWRSDLYFPEGEAGWGVNIVEQGDTSAPVSIFATVFVYDREGRPKWYSVPDLHKFDIAGDQIYYWGTLYESTGPYFGGEFNPAAVTRRAVGSVGFTTWDDDRPADFGFTVEGVSVSKKVKRFAFRKNIFTGDYAGYITHESGGSAEPMTIAIDDDAGFSMRTSSAARTCSYAGSIAQSGHLRRMSGAFSCSDGKTGAFVIRDAEVSGQGFTAKYEVDGRTWGHIGGVRLGG
jgi:hypothetical protein